MRLVFIFCVGLISCQLKSKQVIQKNNHGKPAISMVIISGRSGGYGYDIFVDNNLLIHQPHIPVIPGNKEFKTKESAAKIATLVIEKIKNNQIPPALDLRDLETCGIYSIEKIEHP